MIEVCPAGDVPEGGAVRVDTDPPIALFKVGGELYAVIDRGEYGLTPVHLREWLGYAWVCLAEAPPRSRTP